jgi:hypothetical protein
LLRTTPHAIPDAPAPDAGLVDDEDLFAPFGELPGRGEPVHARADDEGGDGRGE